MVFAIRSLTCSFTFIPIVCFSIAVLYLFRFQSFSFFLPCSKVCLKRYLALNYNTIVIIITFSSTTTKTKKSDSLFSCCSADAFIRLKCTRVHGIMLYFVVCFRATCSYYFRYESECFCVTWSIHIAHIYELEACHPFPSPQNRVLKRD